MKNLLMLLLSFSSASFAAERIQIDAPFALPDRDDLGDVISRFNTENGYWTGIAFDGELLWGVDTEGGRLLSYALDGEAEGEVALPLEDAGFDDEDDESMHGICWDGEAFWLSSWFRPELFQVSRRGELLAQIDLPEHEGNQGAWGVAWDGDALWYILAEGDGILRQINLEGELIRRVDCSEIEAADEIISIEWVPAHDGGHMWWHAGDENYICRLNVGGDEAELIAEEEIRHEEAFGLTHDGEDLWYVTSNEDEEEWFWYEIDDGIEEDDDRIPEIVVEPEVFDFGVVYSGEMAGFGEIEMIVSNTGNADLTISEIVIEEEYFRIEFEDEVVLEPDEAFEQAVFFEPIDCGGHEGTITIHSNDPERGELALELLGFHSYTMRLINPIEDIEIEEDSGLINVADLDEVFSDPCEDMLQFEVREAPEELIMRLSDQNILSLEPTENFFGNELEVVIAATNADEMTLEHSFLVTVTPVNDPPTAIDLLLPENDSWTGHDNIVNFRWERSVDPDSGEQVNYSLNIMLWQSPEDDEPIDNWDFELETDSFAVVFEELIPDVWGCISLPAEWWVTAVSGEDSVECNERFWLEVMGPGEVKPEDGICSRIELQSAYPNPFNSTTTIMYSLPTPTNITLGVYNHLGLQVAILREEFQVQGKHSATFFGEYLPTGVYLVRLESGTQVMLNKMLLIK